MSQLSPLKAIRSKCIDCSAGSVKEVEMCEFTNCPLWRYRLGKGGGKPRGKSFQRKLSKNPAT